MRNNNKILLVCYIPQSSFISYKRFKNIVNNISKDSIIISFDPYSQRLLEEMKAPFKRASSYMNEDDIKKAINYIYEHQNYLWKTFKTKHKLNKNELIYFESIKKHCQSITCEIIYPSILIEKILNVELPDTVWLITNNDIKIKLTVILQVIKTKKLNYKIIPGVKKNIIISFLSKIHSLSTKIVLLVQKLPQYQQNINSYKKPDINKIIFAGYSHGEVSRNLIPILQELIKDNYEPVFLIDGKTKEGKALIKNCQRLGISYLRIENYNGSSNEFYKEIKNLKSNIIKELIIFKGINLLNEKVLWKNLLPKLKIEAIQNCLAVENPKAVIVSDDQSLYGYITACFAKEKGIPIIFFPSQSYQLERFEPFLEHSLADTLLVSGEASKEHCLKAGYDESKIYISGTSKWDTLFNKKRFVTIDELSKKLKFNTKNDIWLFTSQGHEYEIINMLISLAKNYPNKQIIIKLHPFGNKSFNLFISSMILFKNLKNISITSSIDVVDLIANCELLITSTSLTAFEAMIFKKPVIVLDTDYRPYPWSYIAEKCVIAVNNKEQLFDAINKIMQDKRFKNDLIMRGVKYTNRHVYNLGSPSAERIANIINHIIENSISKMDNKSDLLIS